METFLPSDIARLVYGYLNEQGCPEAADLFLRTSEYLTECLVVSKAGQHFHTNILGRNLIDILDTFSEIVFLVTTYVSTTKKKKALIDEAKLRAKLIEDLTEVLSIECRDFEPFWANEEESEDEACRSEEVQVEDIDPPLQVNEEVPDSNVLDTLLSNTVLHKRLAENINKAITLEEKKEESIKAALNTTETDPIFEKIISDIIGSQENGHSEKGIASKQDDGTRTIPGRSLQFSLATRGNEQEGVRVERTRPVAQGLVEPTRVLLYTSRSHPKTAPDSTASDGIVHSTASSGVAHSTASAGVVHSTASAGVVHSTASAGEAVSTASAGVADSTTPSVPPQVVQSVQLASVPYVRLYRAVPLGSSITVYGGPPEPKKLRTILPKPFLNYPSPDGALLPYNVYNSQLNGPLISKEAGGGSVGLKINKINDVNYHINFSPQGLEPLKRKRVQRSVKDNNGIPKKAGRPRKKPEEAVERIVEVIEKDSEADKAERERRKEPAVKEPSTPKNPPGARATMSTPRRCMARRLDFTPPRGIPPRKALTSPRPSRRPARKFRLLRTPSKFVPWDSDLRMCVAADLPHLKALQIKWRPRRKRKVNCYKSADKSPKKKKASARKASPPATPEKEASPKKNLSEDSLLHLLFPSPTDKENTEHASPEIKLSKTPKKSDEEREYLKTVTNNLNLTGEQTKSRMDMNSLLRESVDRDEPNEPEENRPKASEEVDGWALCSEPSDCEGSQTKRSYFDPSEVLLMECYSSNETLNIPNYSDNLDTPHKSPSPKKSDEEPTKTNKWTSSPTRSYKSSSDSERTSPKLTLKIEKFEHSPGRTSPFGRGSFGVDKSNLTSNKRWINS